MCLDASFSSPGQIISAKQLEASGPHSVSVLFWWQLADSFMPCDRFQSRNNLASLMKDVKQAKSSLRNFCFTTLVTTLSTWGDTNNFISSRYSAVICDCKSRYDIPSHKLEENTNKKDVCLTSGTCASAKPTPKSNPNKTHASNC